MPGLYPQGVCTTKARGALPRIRPHDYRADAAKPGTAQRGSEMTDAAAAPEKKERWTASWKHLYSEVGASGLSPGCAGCVIACPPDVLGYDDTNGVYKPL